MCEEARHQLVAIGISQAESVYEAAVELAAVTAESQNYPRQTGN